jgi:hypothetical protein
VPKESSIEIKIRGLGAGKFDNDEEVDHDDDIVYREQETRPYRYIKHNEYPKGIVRISFEGRVFEMSNTYTFRYAMAKHGEEVSGNEIWLPSGKKACVDDKMRYHSEPTLEKIYVLDGLSGNVDRWV